MARTKKRKIVDVNQNCTIEESIINQIKGRNLNIQYLKESYNKRTYYGTANQECQYCGAIFWYDERIKSNHGTITYNLC